MIPGGSETILLQVAEKPSKTFAIGSPGYIDQIEAVKQAVLIILDVARFDNPVVSWNFGHELNKLIGQPMDLAIAEVERYLKEALTQDDRISDVVGFEFTEKRNALLVEFTVVSTFGNFTTETEVNV